MTQVDFHFNLADKLLYACRLARKVYLAGQPLVVYCDDRAVLTRFDQQLWQFSALDFIPHVMLDDPLAADTPVVLTATEGDTPHHSVLLNLGLETPLFFSRFERLLELVGVEEDERQAGRARFKFYRERGYPMQNFDLTKAA
ncbi:DNA polymerase III subunit chi [Parvibium lacunae]|uniref:DNA polymerase III subunit chi n=1 Tax=Parvibium lacunae TaxID=1888893 RepID=A0A368KZL2_9BURK|nr:DNA polymerase III subunit chi [Parvibium lacunae]RCS56461.1 DNA polymerase III subunit chi [Parvibium lacunae]